MPENETTEAREARIERECVEQVFGLTGGELDDRPWVVATSRENLSEGLAVSCRYTYDGAPEYADEHRDHDNTYVTVVEDCSHGMPEPELFEKGARYVLVQSFVSSGETECPLKDGEAFGDDERMAEIVAKRPCELCEAGEGEEHSYIYLGDGWCENVYRKIGTCEDCGTDLTSHSGYGDDRCLACDPYAFVVKAKGVGAYTGDSDVVYQGADPDAASAAFERWANLCDVTLALDGDDVREETAYKRSREILGFAKALLSRAIYCGGPFDWVTFHAQVAKVRKPWDDHAEILGEVSGMVSTTREKCCEARRYIDGRRLDYNVFPHRYLYSQGVKGSVVAIEDLSRTLTVWHWIETDKVESWVARSPGTYTLPDGRVVVEPEGPKVK